MCIWNQGVICKYFYSLMIWYLNYSLLTLIQSKVGIIFSSLIDYLLYFDIFDLVEDMQIISIFYLHEFFLLSVAIYSTRKHKKEEDSEKEDRRWKKGRPPSYKRAGREKGQRYLHKQRFSRTPCLHIRQWWKGSSSSSWPRPTCPHCWGEKKRVRPCWASPCVEWYYRPAHARALRPSFYLGCCKLVNTLLKFIFSLWILSSCFSGSEEFGNKFLIHIPIWFILSIFVPKFRGILHAKMDTTLLHNKSWAFPQFA